MLQHKWLKKQKSTPYINPINAFIALIPITIMLLTLDIFPALLNVVMSFTNYDGVVSETKFVGIDNYINFFKVYGFKTLPALATTFKYMLLVIVPMQIMALGAALLVNIKSRFSNFFRALFFMPSILGTAVVATSWKLMLDPIDGPFAKILAFFGTDSAFLGSQQSLLFIAMIALWAGFGYIMVIYLAGLQGIPTEYYEAAEMDGANTIQKFKSITLPLLWPAVTIALWISLSGTLAMADYIILTTKGQFGTSTLAYYIYESVIENQVHRGQSAATSIYFFIITTTIMLLFNKYIRKREVEM